MPDSDFLSLEIVQEICGPPEVATTARNWHGHVPFARWLIVHDRPGTFVELGVFRGDSYLAICEAVRRFESGTKCVGIDTWAGDAHSGSLADEVFTDLSAYHDPRYGAFSKLRRALFEEAVSEFEDGSIDLLHVDGLHTYEAVSGDYETWLPKMSTRGIMLFHDTQVREGDFGVHRLWAEVAAKNPHFEFKHSHGLGVLAVGAEPSAAMRWLTSQSLEDKQKIATVFTWLGADSAAHVLSRPSDVPNYWFDEDARNPEKLHHRAFASELQEENAELRRAIEAVKSSSSWRMTAPLRKALDLLRRR